jgi:hypothetical protein
MFVLSTCRRGTFTRVKTIKLRTCRRGTFTRVKTIHATHMSTWYLHTCQDHTCYAHVSNICGYCVAEGSIWTCAHHKTCDESGSKGQHILNLRIRWRWFVSSTLRPVFPPWTQHLLLTRTLGGRQRRSDRLEKGNVASLCRQLRHCSLAFHPVSQPQDQLNDPTNNIWNQEIGS